MHTFTLDTDPNSSREGFLRSNLHRGLLALSLVLSIAVTTAQAATTPSLGAAATYGVLTSTYTNTNPATIINGDVGFTTGPAVTPAGTHLNYGPGAPYANAGADQNTALSSLQSQPCTYSFPAGAIDLSTDITHGTLGVYTPGVYCSAGAMNIGGPLSLSGNGTYIFRTSGALTTTAGAIVSLNGASACSVFWTPTQATTLGANTIFAGIIIDAAGITVGANTTWAGMGLAFGGTITTNAGVISVCSAAASSAASSASGSSVSSVSSSISSTLSSSRSSTGSSVSMSSSSRSSVSSSRSSSNSSLPSSVSSRRAVSRRSVPSSVSSSERSSDAAIVAGVTSSAGPTAQTPLLPNSGVGPVAHFATPVVAIALFIGASFLFSLFQTKRLSNSGN